MATTKRVTPGREGYKILFNENTVIMNHKFAAAAAKYGTKENDLMKKIRTDFWSESMRTLPKGKCLRSGAIASAPWDKNLRLAHGGKTHKRKAYDEIYNGQMELLGIAEEESFILGYRIGVRLLLDAIGDHKAQLRMMNGSATTD